MLVIDHKVDSMSILGSDKGKHGWDGWREVVEEPELMASEATMARLWIMWCWARGKVVDDVVNDGQGGWLG